MVFYLEYLQQSYNFFPINPLKTSDRFGQIDPHAYVFVGQGIIGILF